MVFEKEKTETLRQRVEIQQCQAGDIERKALERIIEAREPGNPSYTMFMKRKAGKLFVRPDKNMLPIYKAPDGTYTIQDERNKSCHKFNGEPFYIYSLCFRKKGRAEWNCPKAGFEKLKNGLGLKWCERLGTVDMYEDKNREFYYERSTGKLIIQYQTIYLKWGFESFRDCLEYSEQYLIRRYGLIDSTSKKE